MMNSLPEVGDQAPAFALPDDSGGTVRLADFRGRRVILICYPAAMTPGCTRQAGDLRDASPTLAQAGIEVVAVSPDSPERLAAFRARDRLPYVLLADVDHAVLAAYGAWGPKQLYGKTVTGVIRSTFVIDGSGRLELVRRNVRATGHVGRLLTELGLADGTSASTLS